MKALLDYLLNSFEHSEDLFLDAKHLAQELDLNEKEKSKNLQRK